MAIGKPPEPKNVARDFYIGNTHVKIATDYCEDKTPEEVERILARIASNVMPELVAAELKRREKTQAV